MPMVTFTRVIGLLTQLMGGGLSSRGIVPCFTDSFACFLGVFRRTRSAAGAIIVSKSTCTFLDLGSHILHPLPDLFAFKLQIIIFDLHVV